MKASSPLSPWCRIVQPSSRRRLLPLLAFAVLSLWAAPLPAFAQGGSTTITAAEFQRITCSAHLMTKITEKPELEASLRLLLELHWRNPNVNPAFLAAVLQETTARYRTNGLSFLASGGFCDEQLAAYLDAFRQVPGRTSLVRADLALLSGFMLQSADYGTASAAELIR